MNLAHLDPDVADLALEGRATRLAFLETGVGFIEWPGAMLIMDQALARAEEKPAWAPSCGRSNTARAPGTSCGGTRYS